MWGSSPGTSPPPAAPGAGGLFPPQSKGLGIDLCTFSPGLLKKVVYAGSNCGSFQDASHFLHNLARQDVDPKAVERATRRIGEERLAQRDARVRVWQDLTLAQRDQPPAGPVPDLAVVLMDGGRLQLRPEPDRGAAGAAEAPAEAGAPDPPADAPAEGGPSAGGPRNRCWREDKVGVLLSMRSPVHDHDPCPEVPEAFRDPLRVLKLSQQVGHKAVPAPGTFHGTAAQPNRPPGPEGPGPEGAAAEREQAGERPGRPQVVSRTVLASRHPGAAFSRLLAAAAWGLGLLAAARRAFVADGATLNWAVQQKWFGRFVAVLDFIHVLSYVFAAALAGRKFEDGWAVYQDWIGWVWGGEVARVLRALDRRLGELAEGDKAREAVEETRTYLANHKKQMAYADYRRQGLPIMSSYVESAVKQIGRRVKGSEKFWSGEGAEAVLQLRADYLSDGAPMDAFWEDRAERMTGQRTYRPKAV